MQEEIVIIEEYARQSHIDVHFINQLGENGLIQLTVREQKPCIETHQLPLLEKYTRLHYDLQINMEGIEAISHLLQRMEAVQNELNTLKQTLHLYQYP